jgi:hypothetical protein
MDKIEGELPERGKMNWEIEGESCCCCCGGGGGGGGSGDSGNNGVVHVEEKVVREKVIGGWGE